jgi:endonuclease YncB( thermonuclease family)
MFPSVCFKLLRETNGTWGYAPISNSNVCSANLCVETRRIRRYDLAGRTSIIDGDTLEIHGTRIRLWGIDAPESNQLCRNKGSEHYRCGQKAANDLDAFVGRRQVACVEVDRDRYNRAVAVCAVAATDLAEWLVKNGLAVDWPQYSKGAYAAAQSEAKRANLGMWSGSFNARWRYRACRRTAGSPIGCSDQLNDSAF